MTGSAHREYLPSTSSYIIHAGCVLATADHLVMFGGDILAFSNKASAGSCLRLIYKRNNKQTIKINTNENTNDFNNG